MNCWSLDHVNDALPNLIARSRFASLGSRLRISTLDLAGRPGRDLQKDPQNFQTSCCCLETLAPFPASRSSVKLTTLFVPA